jgi:hypothetical protein
MACKRPGVRIPSAPPRNPRSDSTTVVRGRCASRLVVSKSPLGSILTRPHEYAGRGRRPEPSSGRTSDSGPAPVCKPERATNPTVQLNGQRTALRRLIGSSVMVWPASVPRRHERPCWMTVSRRSGNKPPRPAAPLQRRVASRSASPPPGEPTNPGQLTVSSASLAWRASCLLADAQMLPRWHSPGRGQWSQLPRDTRRRLLAALTWRSGRTLCRRGTFPPLLACPHVGAHEVEQLKLTKLS